MMYFKRYLPCWACAERMTNFAQHFYVCFLAFVPVPAAGITTPIVAMTVSCCCHCLWFGSAAVECVCVLYTLYACVLVI